LLSIPVLFAEIESCLVDSFACGGGAWTAAATQRSDSPISSMNFHLPGRPV